MLYLANRYGNALMRFKQGGPRLGRSEAARWAVSGVGEGGRTRGAENGAPSVTFLYKAVGDRARTVAATVTHSTHCVRLHGSGEVRAPRTLGIRRCTPSG